LTPRFLHIRLTYLHLAQKINVVKIKTLKLVLEKEKFPGM
jgi:hypothetical protein